MSMEVSECVSGPSSRPHQTQFFVVTCIPWLEYYIRSLILGVMPDNLGVLCPPWWPIWTFYQWMDYWTTHSCSNEREKIHTHAISVSLCLTAYQVTHTCRLARSKHPFLYAWLHRRCHFFILDKYWHQVAPVLPCHGQTESWPQVSWINHDCDSSNVNLDTYISTQSFVHLFRV